MANKCEIDEKNAISPTVEPNMKYKNFDEWWDKITADGEQWTTLERSAAFSAWNAAVGQCVEIAKGMKRELSHFYDDDRQTMVATAIMNKIEELKND